MCSAKSTFLFCSFSPSLSGCFEVSVEIFHLIIIPMATSWEKTNKDKVRTSTTGIGQMERNQAVKIWPLLKPISVPNIVLTMRMKEWEINYRKLRQETNRWLLAYVKRHPFQAMGVFNSSLQRKAWPRLWAFIRDKQVQAEPHMAANSPEAKGNPLVKIHREAWWPGYRRAAESVELVTCLLWDCHGLLWWIRGWWWENIGLNTC